MASGACVEQTLACLSSVVYFSFRTYASQETEEEGFTDGRAEAHLLALQEMAAGRRRDPGNAATSSSPAEHRNFRPENSPPKRDFLVRCDRHWHETSFAKVEEALRSFLADLSGHPSPLVRKAVLNLISKVMKECKQFECSRSFLESLLGLKPSMSSCKLTVCLFC